MSLSLRVLLCVSGLVGCSHTAATAAQGPDDAPARTATSSQEPVGPTAQEDPVWTSTHTEMPAARAQGNAISEPPSRDSRTTQTETNDDSDPRLQRIRQAAMADGSL